MLRAPNLAVKFTLSNFPAIGWELTVPQIAAMARSCERAGFDRFAVADIPYHFDCVSVMTACLLATEQLQVESLVANPYTRLPSFAAASWATMAELSGGRVILGLGGGVESASQVWTAPWGLERPHPARAVREGVEVCRRMWAGDDGALDGEVIKSSTARLRFPVRHHIPVLIAARGKVMLRLAGELADIAHMASLFLGLEHQRENIALVREGMSRAGRTAGEVEIDLSLTVCISTSRAVARRSAKRTAAQTILWMAGAERYSKQRSDWNRPAGFAVPDDVVEAIATRWDMWNEPLLPDDLAELISDDILDQFAVAGEPEECSRRLMALAQALPEVTGFRIKLPPPVGAAGTDQYEETIALMGKAIKELRAASTPAVQP